jgi:hypothetical protein
LLDERLTAPNCRSAHLDLEASDLETRFVRLFGWYEPPSHRSAYIRTSGCLFSIAVAVGCFGLATRDDVSVVVQLICAIVVIPLALAGVVWSFIPNHVTCRICNTANDVGRVHLNRIAEGPAGSDLILLECPGCFTLYQRHLPKGPTVHVTTSEARRRFGINR